MLSTAGIRSMKFFETDGQQLTEASICIYLVGRYF